MIQDQYKKKKVEERREKTEGRDSGEVDGRIRRQEGKGRWRETAKRNAMLLFSSCAKKRKGKRKKSRQGEEKRRFPDREGNKKEIMSLCRKGGRT